MFHVRSVMPNATSPSASSVKIKYQPIQGVMRYKINPTQISGEFLKKRKPKNHAKNGVNKKLIKIAIIVGFQFLKAFNIPLMSIPNIMKNITKNTPIDTNEIKLFAKLGKNFAMSRPIIIEVNKKSG
jgi:hypothetical protein